MKKQWKRALAAVLALLLFVHETQAVNMPFPMRALPPPAETLRPAPTPASVERSSVHVDRFRRIRRAWNDLSKSIAVGGRAGAGWLRTQIEAAAKPAEIERMSKPEPVAPAPAADERRTIAAPPSAGVEARADHGLGLVSAPDRSWASASDDPLDQPKVLEAMGRFGGASQPARPRLRRMADLMSIADRDESADGFQTMHLRREQARTSAYYSVASAAASAASSAASAPSVRTGRKSAAASQASFLPIGQRLSLGDGRTIALKAYDPAKAEGQRYAYEITNKDGSRQMFYASPLVFDLKGDRVLTKHRITFFDIDGEGRLSTLDDVADGSGLLVFDADADGRPGKDGRGLFGNNTDLHGRGARSGFIDGFDALWAFVRQAVREGVLDRRVLASRRLDGADLDALRRHYGLRMKVGGFNRPAITLEDAGVASIELPEGNSRCSSDFDGQGNVLCRRSNAVFTRTDGSRGSYDDIWFGKKHDHGAV